MLAALAGCSAHPTEIVVTIDSDLPSELLGEVVVDVTAAGRPPRRTVFDPALHVRPWVLSLRHRGGELGPVRVEAAARRGGADVLRTAAVTRFVRGRRGALSLRLERDCLGVACPVGTVCRAGACEDESFGELRPWDGPPRPLPLVDAGTPEPDADRDGGVPDAGGPDSGTPDAGVPDAGAPDAGSPCRCVRPDDECDASSTACRRSGVVCNALTLCPTGYTCAGAECVCSDPDECGISCASAADCPGDSVTCDTVAGVCRSRPLCLLDSDCPELEVCAHRGEARFAGTCRRPGTRDVAEPCDSDADCAERRCVTGICLRGCRGSRDCPEGQSCGYTAAGLSCVASTSCASCLGADRFCSGGCRESCAARSDCGNPLHECVLGLCRPFGTTTCGDDEIGLNTPDGAPACATRRACWLARDDCPPDTPCVAPSDAYVERGIGLCGRIPET